MLLPLILNAHYYIHTPYPTLPNLTHPFIHFVSFRHHLHKIDYLLCGSFCPSFLLPCFFPGSEGPTTPFPFLSSRIEAHSFPSFIYLYSSINLRYLHSWSIPIAALVVDKRHPEIGGSEFESPFNNTQTVNPCSMVFLARYEALTLSLCLFSFSIVVIAALVIYHTTPNNCQCVCRTRRLTTPKLGGGGEQGYFVGRKWIRQSTAG